MDVDTLVKAFLNKDRIAAGRLISLVENRSRNLERIMSRIYPHTGHAHIVGVTGPPGAGKSTLINGLIGLCRKRGKRVGIVAVDPTSPFTGGAILGDRIRMNEFCTDEGVFIRSMGTRGWSGGLARTTGDIVKLLDAFGSDIVMIETVGAGQSEVSVSKHAHTIIVITVPGLGDDVQTLKAGILETGDIFVVNKADREGADRAVADLQMMIDLCERKEGAWKQPVLKLISTEGKGIAALADAIDGHGAYLAESGLLKKKVLEASREELMSIVKEKLIEHFLYVLDSKEAFDEMVEDIAERKIDPYAAAGSVIKNLELKRRK